MSNEIPEISVEDVHQNPSRFRLIDVRRPNEFQGELGHVPGAELITLGPDLMRFLDEADRSQEIVFICRSGARSGWVTAESQKYGYTRTANMAGGMIRWNQPGLPTMR